MWEQILPGLRINIFATILFGLIYPLAITGICQVFFPYQANGSLIKTGGKVIGSELIGQNFSRPEYFQPRPSAAGSDGYDPTSSGGSNYGPTNQKLIDRVKASVESVRALVATRKPSTAARSCHGIPAVHRHAWASVRTPV